METKRHSFLVRAAMTLLLTVFTTLTTWADTWPAYITDVVLAGGTETEAQSVKNSTAYSGYTWCSTSLNDGTSGDVIYIGYKTSNSANTNGGYITNFIVVDAVDHNPPSSVTCNGHTYYLCPADGGDYFANSNHGNLTSHASQGWNIYLYYTKEHFSDKRAVSSIAINDTKSGAINCYYKDGTLKEENISLNRGVKNTPYVYMHIYTETKVNRPYPEPTTISGLTYDGTSHQLIPSNYDSDYSGDVYFRLGTTGSYTDVVNSITATNAGTYTIYYYSGESYYGNSSVDYAHTISATIAKSPNNGVTVSCSNYLEGTTPVPSLVGNLSTGTVTYQYSTSQSGSYTNTVPSAAGTYWVKATIAADNNCYAYTTAPVSFTITYNWKLHNSGDTEDDAYVISTIADLKYLAVWVNLGNDFAGKFFKLGDNIAFDKSKENNFTPIGNSTYSFTGTFDGQGHTISGLNINKPDKDNVGLFGNTEEATIKNLIVDNSTINGKMSTGAIVGHSGNFVTVTNCRVTNSVTVSGTSQVGGITGVSSTVSGCVSAAAVSGSSFVGGIIGNGNFSSIANNLYTGTSINCPDIYKGAIVGEINGYTTLTANYYTADLSYKATANNNDINGACRAVVINTVDGVTVTPTGDATVYNVSGITAYTDNSGMLYSDGTTETLYAGATEEVNLDITYESPYEGFRLEGYTDGHDNALTHVGGNTYKLTMPTTTAYITPAGSDLWGETDGTGRNGSADHPYLITTPAGLDLLAQKVNGGNDYQDTYFVLGNDIVYAPDVLTLDLDNNGSNDSNYMPVGNNNSSFYGNFDGQGHTISGIRVNANGIYYIGVFGINASTGTVKNLTVSDCLFAGDGYVGAIAGSNRGTVENCHVAADVSVTGNNEVGGVVGNNDGTTHRGFVLGCTSAATLSAKESARYFGGIAGGNTGTLTDNLFTGTIDGMPDGSWSIGAITGYHDTDYSGTLTNNFHTCSGMGGVGNENDATNTDQAGAQFAYEFPTANAAMGAAGSTYAEGETYEGITAYTDGLAYNGNYYCPLPWTGDGTAEHPFVISTTDGLDKLAIKVNGGTSYSGTYFELGNDIDYSEVPLTLDGGKSNYTAIGKYNGSNDVKPFSGIFDGKGHTISGIRITKDGGSLKDSYQGVFSCIRNATVKNVKLADTHITAANRIGGIAGFNSAATIENCHVTNTVTIQSNGHVEYYYGGIAGELNDYNGVDPCVRGCTSAATVIGGEYVGGIVGCLFDGSITDCLYLGTSVTGTKYIGAIVGSNVNNTLSNNYHTLSGVGGCEGSDVDGACFAYEYPAATDIMGTAGTTYGTGDYSGITAYTEGLAYNGKYYCPLPWTGDGTAEHPFVISTTDGLNKLAIKVNAGTSYSGKYFELGNDIDYSDVPLTLDGGKSNYTPVGDDLHHFYGTFDGKGHKVSGIRISKPYGLYKSIFGRITGTVKNLVVSDCSMEAYYWIGGIVSDLQGGTIENCHVLSDVTLTGNGYIGGIASYAGGTVKGCTSAATIIGTKSDSYNAEKLGGIAGYNGGSSTLTDNLFTGTISGDFDKWIGAIVGRNYSNAAILTNNYHTLSGMGGVGNENDATSSDEDGVTIAYELAAANAAMGTKGTTYAAGTDYEGITAYQNGLAYNGKFYSPIPWGGSGTEADPYVIYNTAGMDKLANDVNGGNDYQDTYFVLGNDIVYAPDVLTLDLDGDGNNDSNYMPVGKNGSPFMGHFDGQGHTISGISVNANEMYYIGVFGINDGTVKNLTVSDCLFAGSETIGAVAGLNRGTVENCHVAAYVSVTGNNTVGGIVGNNEGSVIGCTSAATLSTNNEYAGYFGGIAGSNTGTLTDNLFTGTIDKMPDGSWGIGAITGYHNTDYDGTLTNNFHTCSGMGGVGNEGNATNTDQAGALFAVSSTTKPDAATIGTAGTAYAYQGITPYTKGLYYKGLYYYKDPNIVAWAGQGTAENPYVIRTTTELDLLATNVNGGESYNHTYFELGDDIAYDKSQENNYTPIGNNDYYFMGHFDGKGYKVSGLNINLPENNYVGLFGFIYSGSVKNLTLTNSTIIGQQYVGSIAGNVVIGAAVENCHVTSDCDVNGTYGVGGIVCSTDNSTIGGCTSAATVSGTQYVSGIVGSNNGSTIKDCLYMGNVVSATPWAVGAIVGYNISDAATLTNNYYTQSGVGGVNGIDEAGKAEFAVSSTTDPGNLGAPTTTYAKGESYQGITAYEHALYYNGKYYYWSENIVVPGDANGDGRVTISDAVAIVNYILGKAPAGFNEAAADMNGDGKVTITDAVMLVNMIGSQP